MTTNAKHVSTHDYPSAEECCGNWCISNCAQELCLQVLLLAYQASVMVQATHPADLSSSTPCAAAAAAALTSRCRCLLLLMLPVLQREQLRPAPLQTACAGAALRLATKTTRVSHRDASQHRMHVTLTEG